MEQEQPKLRFFIDRGLGRNIVPDAIRQKGYDVVIHDDIFSQDTSDAEWLAEIGKQGLIFLSKDQNIEKNPAEVMAVMRARVHGFVLFCASSTGTQNANAFCLALPNIVEICSRTPPPTLHRVYLDGKLSNFKNYDNLYRDFIKLQEDADYQSGKASGQ